MGLIGYRLDTIKQRESIMKIEFIGRPIGDLKISVNGEIIGTITYSYAVPNQALGYWIADIPCMDWRREMPTLPTLKQIVQLKLGDHS